jgi:adenylate kinase
LDGYPRTAAQAEALDLLLTTRGQALEGDIQQDIDAAALIDRIVGRYTCAACGTGYHDRYKLPLAVGTCDVCGSTEFKRRPDDNAETVSTRMAEYRAKTAPILPFYEARGLVRRVDGMADMETVGGQIAAILDA